MTKKEHMTQHQTHPHKKFFGGKILTGILLVIVLAALGATIVFVYAPITNTDKVEVAALLPLTGDYAGMGQIYQKGIEMAVSELKKSGNTIEVKYFDTRGDPNLALDAFFTIADSNISAVLGPTTTAETEAIAPYAEMYRIPLITYATGSSLAKYKNYIFRFDPSNNNFCNAIVNLAKSFGIPELSVVWSETSLGKSTYDNIVEAASEENINIISVPITSIDAVISKLNETKTEIAYIEGESTDQVSKILLAQKAADSPYPYLWVTSDSGFGNVIRDIDFDTSAVLVLVPTVSTVDPLFLSNYKDRYGEAFDVSEGYLLYGYDAVMTLASTITTDTVRNGEKIAENLRNYRYLGLTGPIFFNEDLQRFPLYELYVPNNGEWQNMPILTLIDQLETLVS